MLAAILAIAGILVGRRLWYQYRARLFLERRGSQEPPDITRLRVGSSGRDLFDTPATRTAIRRLRRRIPAQARTVDVERTLAHFMRNGGWLSPVYASRQELPEYIVLVSRTSYPDHLANLVDELLAVLHSGSVYLSIYYFDATPELCAAGAQRGRAVTLPELAAGAAGQRLLIFGEAQVMLDPLGGEPAAWTRLLKAWPVHALFTPNPPGDWGAAEQQAARVVAVWPALPEGLDLFIRTVHGEEGTDYLTDRTRAAALPSELRARPIRWLEPDAPPAADVQRVLTGVRGYLGDWGYTWLCACAIYPEVRWNLTLFLGAYLAASYAARPGASANAGDTGIGSPGSVQSPYFQRTLLDLVRLPWFRYGTIPDWLRRVLIAGLTREQEAAVRTALQGLLLTSLDNPGSGFQLEIAHAYQKTMRHLVKPLLDLLRRNAPPHSPLNDSVFLTFMSGHNRTQLAVRLPEALAAAWRRQERVPRPAPEELAAGVPGTAAGTPPASFPDTRLGGGAMSSVPPPPALSRWENVRALLASRTTWLLIGVGALVLGITAVVFYALSSYLLLLPADKFNIAVADIGIVDPGGSVRDGPESGVLAGAIAVTLRSLANDAGDTLPATADPVMVWTDSLSEPRKMVTFDIVAGATAADRSAAAANLAAGVNADVVIYGDYSRGDTTSDAQGELVLRVYPAPQLADPELAYAFDLLTPHLQLSPAAVQDGNATQQELVAALRPQLAAIFFMLAGRLQSLAGNSDAAHGLYGQAQAALAASGTAAAGENDGIWQLVGREAQRRGSGTPQSMRSDARWRQTPAIPSSACSWHALIPNVPTTGPPHWRGCPRVGHSARPRPWHKQVAAWQQLITTWRMRSKSSSPRTTLPTLRPVGWTTRQWSSS